MRGAGLPNWSYCKFLHATGLSQADRETSWVWPVLSVFPLVHDTARSHAQIHDSAPRRHDMPPQSHDIFTKLHDGLAILNDSAHECLTVEHSTNTMKKFVRYRVAIVRFLFRIVHFRNQIVPFLAAIACYRAKSFESEEPVKRHHPKPDLSLPISREIYSQLFDASLKTGFEKEDWEIATIAIQEWAARNNPERFGMAMTSGYQWKHVFLPTGTLLRTIYNGKNHVCEVQEDCIRFKDSFVSPSGFANAVGGVRRNAWKVVWILFPNTTVWKLSETLRKKIHGRTRSAGRHGRA